MFSTNSRDWFWYRYVWLLCNTAIWKSKSCSLNLQILANKACLSYSVNTLSWHEQMLLPNVVLDLSDNVAAFVSLTQADSF